MRPICDLKILLLLVFFFLTMSSWAQESLSYSIPLIGNAFEIGHHQGPSAVRRNSVEIRSNNKNQVRVYFKTLGTGAVHLDLKVKSSSTAKLTVDFQGKQRTIEVLPNRETYSIGDFVISKPGYSYVSLSSAAGDFAVSDLLIRGEGTKEGLIYANNPEYYYWARRGPSCHLNYKIPTTDNVEYYYNEVLVPVGEDVRGSYFMANGFGEGYFGMQVNSETERRILFSVWSPFHTDDPKSIPEDEKITMLKKGKDVHTGEFGNEGSGGQSFLRYNWKAGETYKFLLKGKPDGNNSTDYTAWIKTPESESWQLIASFKRPKTNTYLKRFHSFLENFDPNQGYLKREVNFNNQWVYDGAWKKVTGASLSVDNTYRAKQRVDATGGTTKQGYFLRMGGFFDEIEKPGTSYTFEHNSSAPEIDLSKLP